MEFTRRLTSDGREVIYSLAFKFSQREVMGVERITDDPENVPLQKIEKMEDPDLVLCFLRVFLHSVKIFNDEDQKVIEEMIRRRRVPKKKRRRRKKR